MKADAKTEAEVRAVLNRFAEAYANRDLGGALELFAPDPDLVLFGTGRDEKLVGLTEFKAQLERDWSQSAAASFKFEWTSVSAAGSVAWVAGDSVIHWEADGQEMSLQLRATIVLERRDDKWLCVQWHMSAPLAGQAEGESFPTSIDTVASSVRSEQPDLRPHAAPDGTVTLFFTDIEGSSVMTERLGDVRWLELLHAHNALVRKQVRSHGGYEVKSEGDGYMIAFGSARRALQCAIAMQRDFAEHNAQAKEPMLVRIGLHTGEAIKDADDFFGRHVILAARIADEARGGEILVSGLVKELTASGGDIAFGEGRDVELKGLSGSQRVFAVTWG
jgi:uncharacterized protein (TIGR02246 family)